MEQIGFFDLLAAPGPFAEYPDKLMLFGQFVGSWDMDGTWYERDGSSRKGKGEWHFNWILGGRGIQDVLFASGALPHQRESTLRYTKQLMPALERELCSIGFHRIGVELDGRQ